MSMKSIPHHTPLLYSKTGVYRGVPIFLIFGPKHRLWVFFTTTHDLCFEQKYKKKYIFFSGEIFIFFSAEKKKKKSVYCMGMFS